MALTPGLWLQGEPDPIGALCQAPPPGSPSLLVVTPTSWGWPSLPQSLPPLERRWVDRSFHLLGPQPLLAAGLLWKGQAGLQGTLGSGFGC